MLSPFDLIYAVVTGLALIAGFVIEWRRGGDFEGRLAALEAAAERAGNHEHRIANLEGTMERFRRNL